MESSVLSVSGGAYCSCCLRLSDCCICSAGPAEYYGEECKTCKPLTNKADGPDVAVAGMSREELAAEVLRLRAGIRQHRDERGNDRCWMDDHRLYMLLPEKDPGVTTLLPKREFLENCARYCEQYWETRQRPGEIVLDL